MAGSSLHYRQCFAAIHDILIREWDPLGVCDEPMAQDEYDSIIPGIYRLVVDGVSDELVAGHLDSMARDWFGILTDHQRNLRVASRLRERVGNV